MCEGAGAASSRAAPPQAQQHPTHKNTRTKTTTKKQTQTQIKKGVF
jgi:hypothetical protein